MNYRAYSTRIGANNAQLVSFVVMAWAQHPHSDTNKQTEAMIIMIAMAVEYLELCYLWLYYYVVLFFFLLLSTHILVYSKRKLTGASIHTVAG